MRRLILALTFGASSLLLSGCAGLLPLDHADLPGHRPGNLRVKDIADHFACEISQAKQFKKLADNQYIVKILLTLEVDDMADLTPSLTSQRPLTGSFSVSVVASGDLGYQRKRLFTTTYNIDAAQLYHDVNTNVEDPQTHEKHPITNCLPTDRKTYFNFDGNIGLSQVIDDGLAVLDTSDGVIANPTKANDSWAPTFGTQVQFVITKSLTSLGPTWSLKYFKGPSDKNGLFSGKYYTTDTVIIGFAPQKVDEQAHAILIADLDTATKEKEAAEGRKQAALEKKALLQAQADQLSARAKTLQDTALHQRSRAKALVAANDAKQAQAAAANTQGQLAEADKEVATTTKEAALADAKQKKATVAAATAPVAQARDNANAAATQQVTNILLQNLSSLTH